MVGKKKRKDEAGDSRSSDSDNEVLSKVKKRSVKKKRSKTSDDESSAESTSEKSVEKSKRKKEKQRSGRPMKPGPASVIDRLKRNAESSKEKSETNDGEKSSQEENDRSEANGKGKSEKPAKKSSEKRSVEKRKSEKRSSDKHGKKQKNAKGEEEYEVEEILDFKIEDNMKYFLVRWKGYDSSADSWVYQRDLRCTGLIAQFYETHPDARISTQKSKKKKLKKSIVRPPPALKIDEKPDYDSEAFDENQEWKVEKILDVRYRRNKKREFLIHWKEFSSKSDSWEPEENLYCDELISKFMAKLEAITNASPKELRPVRKPTQRYTLMDVTKGRRLSKRLDGRQRAAYYDCEE